MKKRASDIHIEPQKDEIRVRYRIDGELFIATIIPIEKLSQLVGRLKAISNMHQEKQEAQDGRILLYDDYNIRVSSQPNVYGEKFVLRLLKKDVDVIATFDGVEERYGKDFPAALTDIEKLASSDTIPGIMVTASSKMDKDLQEKQYIILFVVIKWKIKKL